MRKYKPIIFCFAIAAAIYFGFSYLTRISAPDPEPYSKYVVGSIGRLEAAELERIPVVRDQADLPDLGRSIESKNLTSMNQMMDGGRLKFYNSGSRLEVVSIRGKSLKVRLMDGWEGWIIEGWMTQ